MTAKVQSYYMLNIVASQKIRDADQFIDWLACIPNLRRGHRTVAFIFETYNKDQTRKLLDPFQRGTNELFEDVVLARILAQGIIEELSGPWNQMLNNADSRESHIIGFLNTVAEDLLVCEYEMATTVPRLDLPISRRGLWSTWPEYLQRLVEFDENDK